jgi:general secretion pathway protein G
MKTTRLAGFTLLEILVVVLIITILATVVGVRVANRPGEARVVAAKAQMTIFRTAIGLYRMHHGRVPTTQQGLQALCRRPTVPPLPDDYPDEGYLDSANLPQDPWGNPYVYLAPGPLGTPFEIASYGADGEPGGEGEAADILLSAL